MDVHPPKNGINRYWSIPIYIYYIDWTLHVHQIPKIRPPCIHGTHGCPPFTIMETMASLCTHHAVIIQLLCHTERLYHSVIFCYDLYQSVPTQQDSCHLPSACLKGCGKSGEFLSPGASVTLKPATWSSSRRHVTLLRWELGQNGSGVQETYMGSSP